MTGPVNGAPAVKVRNRSALLQDEAPPLNVEALSALGLSRRESEVLAWVAQGKTNSEIAAALGINLGTVKKHLAALQGRLPGLLQAYKSLGIITCDIGLKKKTLSHETAQKINELLERGE